MKADNMGAVDKKGQKLVAPDGGWGWLVVFGVSVINLATRSIEPSFGLLFGDKLRDMGIATTGASVIMSTCDATINFSGLFVGPLIKKYSYRKVALVGSLLSALGFTLTFPAESMTHILSTYSIIGGLGIGFAWSSTFVALNHYFSKKRGQAIGLSMVGTAMGMMAMPQLVQLLLVEYNFRGAVLILGAVACHSIAGSMLLQPIKWHLRPEKPKKEQEMVDLSEKNGEAQSPLLEKPKIEVRSISTISASDDVEKQEPMNRKKSQQMLRIVSSASMTARKRKESIISNISSMDFTGSTCHIHTHVESDDEDGQPGGLVMKKLRNKSSPALCNDINKNYSDNEKKPEHHDSYWKRIVTFMDLDLLKDYIYLNILFGLSIFYVAELNFKMIVPFFLNNLGFTKQDTAFFLSMTALADILARAVLPPICDRVKIKRRTLFAVASIFLGISRSVLAEQTSYNALLIALFVNGFFRGATLINFMLTISEHCSLEKLPAAFGLHMVAKGLFIVALGPLIGAIRDITDSYPLCIHSQTLLIMLCVIAWGLEYFFVRKSSKNNQNQDNT